MNTSHETTGGWSAWYTATTTTGVALPDLPVTAPLNFGNDALLLQIWSWDPTSCDYTGYREITLTHVDRQGQISSFADTSAAGRLHGTNPFPASSAALAPSQGNAALGYVRRHLGERAAQSAAGESPEDN